MRNVRNFFRLAVLSFSLVGACCAACSFSCAQQPDNTRANKGNMPSADQQSNDPADRDLAKKIRQSIASDSSLSTYAHNVKVIVRHGEVTLKGPVKTEDEKSAVESKAAAIAGQEKVQNQITVKAGAQ